MAFQRLRANLKRRLRLQIKISLSENPQNHHKNKHKETKAPPPAAVPQDFCPRKSIAMPGAWPEEIVFKVKRRPIIGSPDSGTRWKHQKKEFSEGLDMPGSFVDSDDDNINNVEEEFGGKKLHKKRKFNDTKVSEEQYSMPGGFVRSHDDGKGHFKGRRNFDCGGRQEVERRCMIKCKPGDRLIVRHPSPSEIRYI